MVLRQRTCRTRLLPSVFRFNNAETQRLVDASRWENRMKNIRKQLGVTLMELVVTVAILGILAAIGTPVLLGNLRTAKNVDAQNTLNSIYLMQKNYFAENNCYYASTSRTNINQNLFGSLTPNEGPITDSSKNDFDFSIIPGAIGSSGACTGTNANDYVAIAMSRSDNRILYKINQQNVKTGY